MKEPLFSPGKGGSFYFYPDILSPRGNSAGLNAALPRLYRDARYVARGSKTWAYSRPERKPAMSAFGYKRTLSGSAIYVRFSPLSGHPGF